ncbi:hypothetical protein ACIA58_19600 [Kribbella sp. NPDC051586]
MGELGAASGRWTPPGYSAEMHSETLATYTFPAGTYWASTDRSDLVP